MKRIIVFILCLALITGTLGIAESLYDYSAYLSSMMEEFRYGEFASALAIFDGMCAVWPDAQDRKGGADTYAVYCRARIAMSEKDYNTACRLFSSLDGDFPEQYDVPKAGSLNYYCEAQRYLNYGYTDEAIAYFYLCGGILDSSAMISMLLKGQEKTVIGLKTLKAESDSAIIMWDDLADKVNDAYYITYYPEGMDLMGKTVRSDMRVIELGGLIPETRYSVFVVPYSGGAVNGASESMEFTTAKAKEGLNGIRLQKNEMYSYSVGRRNSLNAGAKKDVFMDYLLSGSKIVNGYYSRLEAGADIKLPLGGMNTAEEGYIYRCVFSSADRSEDTLNVRLVLRPDTKYDGTPGGVYVKDIECTFTSGVCGFCVYLDDVLEEIYTYCGGWPMGTGEGENSGVMFLYIYARDCLVYGAKYRLCMN